MKARLLSWLWPAVGVLCSVAEVIQSVPDYTNLTWADILQRSLKALPLAILGFIARAALLKNPPKDDNVNNDAGKPQG